MNNIWIRPSYHQQQQPRITSQMNKESESSLLAVSGLSLTLLNITITTMVIERVPILYVDGCSCNIQIWGALNLKYRSSFLILLWQNLNVSPLRKTPLMLLYNYLKMDLYSLQPFNNFANQSGQFHVRIELQMTSYPKISSWHITNK